jgi:hypothetical protein
MDPGCRNGREMGLRGLVEPERFAVEVCELAREDPCAHQAIRGVRVRLEREVADLVRHGAAKDHPDPSFPRLQRVEPEQEAGFLDDAPSSCQEATANAPAPS